MNNREYVFLVAGLIIGAILCFLAFQFVFPPTTVLPVFSPDNGDQVVDFIRSANKTIDMEMYTFSSQDALDAVIAAKERGVNVRILLEKRIEGVTNARTYDRLKAAGIDVKWASSSFHLTHAKTIIVDGKAVVVGSHNLSNDALQNNREASVILSGPAVREFERVFESDWSRK